MYTRYNYMSYIKVYALPFTIGGGSGTSSGNTYGSGGGGSTYGSSSPPSGSSSSKSSTGRAFIELPVVYGFMIATTLIAL